MRTCAAFFRREKVLSVSLAAAALSMIWVAPDRAYLSYVDFDVLMLLFSLMAVVAGLKRQGAFDLVSRALSRRAGDLRGLVALLSLACFFFSMLVTNDVALLTFVPLTVSLLSARPDALIYAVSLETVAANLGSMATPVGNPQNLYLYTHYDMRMDAFLGAVLPLAAFSLALVLLSCLPVRREPLPAANGERAKNTNAPASRALTCLYAVQFILCLLSVFKVIPKVACFLFVLITMLIANRDALKKVDYALLLTFVCFFVFVGNLGRIGALREFLTSVIAGRELAVGILSSQVISNVPAALMLSGFTENAFALLRGVNIGGLGTLVASLASLISFKLYMKSDGARAGRYLKVFTLMNLIFLAALWALTFII